MENNGEYFLLARLKDGNPAAFEALYEMYFKRVASYACRFLKDTETAYEITQEVFLKIWEKKETLVVESPFIRISLAIARNLCIDYLRKQASRKKYETREARQDRYLTLGALTDPVSEKLILNDIESIVETSFESLPEVNKIIYKMNREEGLTYSKIADKLDVSVKTVEYRMMQTLRILRVRLKDFLVFFLLFNTFS
jgi:RNA polymerase sigma-70 factor (ECF subfamily)